MQTSLPPGGCSAGLQHGSSSHVSALSLGFPPTHRAALSPPVAPRPTGGLELGYALVPSASGYLNVIGSLSDVTQAKECISNVKYQLVRGDTFESRPFYQGYQVSHGPGLGSPSRENIFAERPRSRLPMQGPISKSPLAG